MTSALTADLYELMMMQGYLLSGNKKRAVFDMFYRNNPFDGGYVLFAGLDDFIDKAEDFAFSKEDIDYLHKLTYFKDDFLSFLETYRFSGDVYSFNEGDVAFPGEPLIRVESDIMDAQLIESMLLNTINFQTLIATKASRMVNATKGVGKIMEFGLRRAQGDDGALSASRASFIGGTISTSNTLAGKKYGIPVSGTMAHSWIMSYESEKEAFRAFASLYPTNSIFLIDTYDTLGSGIEAAIEVGLEQKKKGFKIGVRIDSGDLSYLSKAIRKKLNSAGLDDAIICVSNDINEDIIRSLVSDGAPIDSWGIGTNLVTGGYQSSLNGVYKLSAKEGKCGMESCLKISNSYEKTTNPGIKDVYRFFDSDGMASADLIALSDEKIVPGKDYVFYHPSSSADMFNMPSDGYGNIRKMLTKKIEGGKRIVKRLPLKDIQNYAMENLEFFDRSYKRLVNPHIYKVSLTEELKNLKTRLVRRSRFPEASNP